MIRAAIVGLGWWGSTVARGLAGSEYLSVKLGVEPDTGRAAEVGRDLGLDVVADLDIALKRPDLDAVILCTPHGAHAEQIIAVANAGKHVFCEKPLTVTAAEAVRALQAVQAGGVQIGIGHERRFEPAVQELQRCFADGTMGVPLVFEGNFSQDKFLALPPDNWRLSATLAPVGPLSATGIHLVDLAISILGRPTEVWARLGQRATAFANGDTLTVTIGFASGATAMITAVLTTPFIGRVAVMGSQGWMEIRDRSHPENPTGWDVSTQLRDQEPLRRYEEPFPAVRENLESFARAIEGGAPYPVSQQEMLLNVQTFEAITRSARSGTIEAIL